MWERLFRNMMIDYFSDDPPRHGLFYRLYKMVSFDHRIITNTSFSQKCSATQKCNAIRKNMWTEIYERIKTQTGKQAWYFGLGQPTFEVLLMNAVFLTLTSYKVLTSYCRAIKLGVIHHVIQYVAQTPYHQTDEPSSAWQLTMCYQVVELYNCFVYISLLSA